MDLSADEKLLIHRYRSVNDIGQANIWDYTEIMILNPKKYGKNVISLNLQSTAKRNTAQGAATPIGGIANNSNQNISEKRRIVK